MYINVHAVYRWHQISPLVVTRVKCQSNIIIFPIHRVNLIKIH